jgi:FAD dependent oxidoreductase TIGR03364
VLHSPHELRVESTDAIPRLAAWLAEAHGVEFRRDTVVHDATPPVLTTSGGAVRAARVAICPGDDYRTLHADRIAAYGLTKCQLQMLRVRPATPTRLGAAVMSDHGLARYAGYAALPETAALQARLEAETPRTRAAGIHLIAVQSGDGSLVVGDSHHYAPTPPPFASDRVDSLILDELHAVLDLPGAAVTERWTGIYASASDRTMLRDAPTADSRLVIVTGGTGASTAFAIGEETVAELFGKE